jgi:hypothetical protein
MGVMAAVSLAMSAASTVMQHQDAQSAADDANKAADANAKLARESAITQYGQLQQRELQEREASGQKSMQTAMDARALRARALASADDAGVTGLSVDALLRDINGQEGRAQTAIDRNLGFVTSDSARRRRASTQTLATVRTVCRLREAPP